MSLVTKGTPKYASQVIAGLIGDPEVLAPHVPVRRVEQRRGDDDPDVGAHERVSVGRANAEEGLPDDASASCFCDGPAVWWPECVNLKRDFG